MMFRVLCVVAILVAACVALPAMAQCPGGRCPTRQPSVSVDVRAGKVSNWRQTNPKWRYEHPKGHRAAVVRIYCETGGRDRSIGSGVLVRWGSKIFVLTARHVVKDAKRVIVELFTRKTHWATVVKCDTTWDCAVLSLVGTPEGVEPAEVEVGSDAMATAKEEYETCGYGSDNKLAANTGVFLGYRRPSGVNVTVDDWLIISGHARGGDSGGPVFNRRGKVVGVLWGTDGSEVVCVQAGRVHVLLNEAISIKRYEQKSERYPTPAALGPMVEVEEAKLAKNRPPMLPWRGESEQKVDANKANIERLIELEMLRQKREAQEQKPPVAQPPSIDILTPPKIEPKEPERSPLVAGLCVVAGIVGGFVVFFSSQKG